MASVRVLFFADTHLGFDLPQRPRVERRRRGLDFFANYELVVEAALARRFDLVIHGGDVLYRSRVPARLVQQAFQPLKRIADTGVPVFVVPGNHERSRIPFDMLALHPGIHIFDRPRTFTLETAGGRVAVSGFPYAKGVRDGFPELIAATDWRSAPADLRLLCVHHCVEGATVGPADYVFRNNPDVIRIRDIPGEFAALLSGHIHRHQVLTADLRGRPAPAPVFYPGSIERTSFAEKDETKGYLEMEFTADGSAGGRLTDWSFVELPARPMEIVELAGDGVGPRELAGRIARAVATAPSEAVLQIRIRGAVPDDSLSVLAAPGLREMAPRSMNLEVVLPDMRTPRVRTKGRCK